MKNKKEALKRYDKLLKSYIENKEIIKVEREFRKVESNISGFLLEFSKDFLLMQREEDFRLDGYSIIPKYRFDSIRKNKFDKTQKRILKKEGITQREHGIDYVVDLTDWRSVFKSLKKNDLHVIVECEDKKNPIFLIGPIKRVKKKLISVQYYDATGKLDDELTTLYYKDITIIRFEERYINVFRKYLRKKNNIS